jgi:hypothetical protein
MGDHNGGVNGNVKEVNQRIRELAGRSGHDEPRLFLCECHDPLCVEEIALTVREFDSQRTLGGLILAHAT